MPRVLHLNHTFVRFAPEARWEDNTLAHTSAEPHSLLYLLPGRQHAWPGISGLVVLVCATALCVSAYVSAEACNKVSMWPPTFRLVEPINLPLYSNTGHLWPAHRPIHIFFAGPPAPCTFSQYPVRQEMDLYSEVYMQTQLAASDTAPMFAPGSVCRSVFLRCLSTPSLLSDLRVKSCR